MQIYLSTNKQLVKEIRQKLKANDGYCPCKVQKTPETKCMCKEFIESQQLGPCHCGLYIKKEI